MVKWKILIMVILYAALGVIAYFNFGFQHVLIERFGEKSTLNQSVLENLEGNNQAETLQEFQDPSIDQSERE